MKRKFRTLKKAIMPALLAICTICFIWYMADVLIYTLPKMQYTADNCYDETLTVFAREDFAPYSFVDEKGNLAGYNVELVNLLANEMQMNVEMKLLPREDCFRALETGEADVVCNSSYTPKFEQVCLLSAPAGRHRVVVFGKKPFDTIRDLYDVRIATVAETPLISDLHVHLGFSNLISYNTYGEAFAAVDCGEVDYIAGAYATLEHRANTLGYSHIKALSSVLNTETFAMGISKNNVALRQKINDALLTLDENGLYDKISSKWLGNHVSAATNEDIVRRNMPNTIVVYTLSMMFLFYFVVRPLRYKAQIDEATKLYDKASARRLIRRKLAAGGAMMVIDINKFKQVNDTYGHAIGDEVIKDVASCLRKATRTGDILGRIGGDEFVAYLPAMNSERNALRKAVQIRDAVRKKTAENPKGAPSGISIGIAFHQKNEPYGSLFVRADKALYQAKTLDERVALFQENMM